MFLDARLVTSRSRPLSKSAAPRQQPTLEESLVLALFDLANHLQRRGERLAARANLTTQQWLVLLQIANDPNFPHHASSGKPVLASDIARMRGVSRATVSAVVTTLKSRGLIREVPDPDDRRRRYLVITRSGMAALDKIEADRRAANQRLFAGLAPADRRRMSSYVESCLAVLWDVHEDEQLAAARRKLKSR